MLTAMKSTIGMPASRSLCDGERYDVEEGVFIDEDEVPDEYDEERYQDLYWYLQDNLGIKVLTDLDRETMYGCEICVAWGGPNIYINTNTRNIEGYWGFDEVTYPLSLHVCDEIDDLVDEMRGYY